MTLEWFEIYSKFYCYPRITFTVFNGKLFEAIVCTKIIGHQRCWSYKYTDFNVEYDFNIEGDILAKVDNYWYT